MAKKIYCIDTSALMPHGTSAINRSGSFQYRVLKAHDLITAWLRISDVSRHSSARGA